MSRRLRAARSVKETRWCPPLGGLPTDWELRPNATTIEAAANEAESRVRDKYTGPGEVIVEVREVVSEHVARYAVAVSLNDVRSVRPVGQSWPELIERIESQLDESIESHRAPVSDA